MFHDAALEFLEQQPTSFFVVTTILPWRLERGGGGKKLKLKYDRKILIFIIRKGRRVVVFSPLLFPTNFVFRHLKNKKK